jgi:hypothetical protein
LRKQQLASGRPVLEAIFKAYRVERAMQNGNALAVLQEQLAAHAPELIQHNFIDLKTLISTMQSLETSRSGDGGTGSQEAALQNFLRGTEPAPAVEGTIQ